jgi:tetratricopeptide (TPR) repeat protein
VAAKEPISKQKTRAPAVAPPEPVASREEKLAAWVESNRKAIGIAAGVIVLVVVVTWFMAQASARRERFAQAGLETAWALTQQGNLPQAATELQRIIQGFSGTQAALQARLSLNHTRILSGQNQLAADDLREFLGRNPPARIRYSAAMLLGVALENLGQAAEAAPAYEAAAAAAEMDYEKSDALVAAARAYRHAGAADRAIATLRQVIERYPGTAGYAVAEVRLGELLAAAGPGT